MLYNISMPEPNGTINVDQKSVSPPPSVKKLDELVAKSQRILYKTKTVFPFDLFPDEIIIDENKIDIIVKPFFYTENIFPILLKNIHGVNINATLFFASITFELTGIEANPGEIRFLWQQDAYKIKRIVTGLTAAVKEGIDLSQIPQEELVAKVEEIGRARNF